MYNYSITCTNHETAGLGRASPASESGRLWNASSATRGFLGPKQWSHLGLARYYCSLGSKMGREIPDEMDSLYSWEKIMRNISEKYGQKRKKTLPIMDVYSGKQYRTPRGISREPCLMTSEGK